MPIPGLNETFIRTHSSPDSFSRGHSYYDRGAVVALTLRGNTLQGGVEGSQYTPYRVTITFDQGGITSASCTCPYDWGGWCKHIVAVLLACLHDTKDIETRPPLETLLAELDRAQLQALLIGLAERDPNLTDSIERQVTLLRLASATPQARQSGGKTRRSPIDQEAIRQQVSFVMRPAKRGGYNDYDYYDEEDPGSQIVEGVRPLLDQARSFIASGDARSALAVLEALTESYIDSGRELFNQLEEMYGSFEGAAVEFFDELSEAWAEAILSADLDGDERDEWGEKIVGWRDEADDIGAAEAFDLALTAANQGWDYPPLLRVFAGEITEKGAWEGEAPDYAEDLTLVRLRILERQGRHQEYLYLAEAEGQLERYVIMLAKVGRTQEAVDEGLKYLTTPNDVLEVAKVLRERGELVGAVQLAEHGLALKLPEEPYATYSVDLEHQKAPLAAWLADLAAGMGDGDRALRAAQVAFRAAPSLNAYLKVQELAGEHWEQVKPELLENLRRSRHTEAKVDIFLREGQIDDAIAAVKDGYGYSMLERVMDAAITTRSDWVIETATTQAERIIDAGKAQHYDHAVGWLRRARDAYRATGRQDEWRVYLGGIRTQHGRKHKLMGLLQQL